MIKKANGRLWEIDAIRGIALIIMILFHFFYDLNHFGVTNYKLYTGLFSYLAYITASVFVILAGVSLTINLKKSQKKYATKEIYKRFILRGIKIFLLGVIITLITLFYIPERFVLFGVLHCIGISIILAIPFLSYKTTNILLGIPIIAIGMILRTMTFDFEWFIPLGFLPQRYFTIDYFPLFPWFGVILIGIALGNLLYPDAQRSYKIREQIKNPIPKGISFIGRHSLHVYFLHQPILILIILLIFK